MKLPRPPKSNAARIALTLPLMGVVALLLYWRGPSLRGVGDAFTAVRWQWVVVAIGINLLSVVVRALAWTTVIHQAIPAPQRHLAVHEDHLIRVTERDRSLFNGDLLRAFSWTAPAPELRERLDALEATGVTEVLYAPMGPDIPRELRAFMEMATAK